MTGVEQPETNEGTSFKPVLLGEKETVRETRLFNLKENRHGLLAAQKDSQHAAKLAEMRALLLAEMRRLNGPWRFSDQPDDGLAPPQEGKPRVRKKPRKK